MSSFYQSGINPKLIFLCVRTIAKLMDICFLHVRSNNPLNIICSKGYPFLTSSFSSNSDGKKLDRYYFNMRKRVNFHISKIVFFPFYQRVVCQICNNKHESILSNKRQLRMKLILKYFLFLTKSLSSSW